MLNRRELLALIPLPLVIKPEIIEQDVNCEQARTAVLIKLHDDNIISDQTLVGPDWNVLKRAMKTLGCEYYKVEIRKP